MSETELTKIIRSYLKNLGIFHWKAWQGPMSQPKGMSDILGVIPASVSREKAGEKNRLAAAEAGNKSL